MKNLYMGASLVVLSAFLSSSAVAAAAAADTTAGVSEVIVTGTRVTGVKAEDSAAPVQVVGAGALMTGLIMPWVLISCLAKVHSPI